MLHAPLSKLMSRVLTPAVSRDTVLELGAVDQVVAGLQFLRSDTIYHTPPDGKLHTISCAFEFLSDFVDGQEVKYFEMVAQTGVVQLAIKALRAIHESAHRSHGCLKFE